MALNQEEIVRLYRRRAKLYDLTAQLYYVAGFREWAYRGKAVDALALKSGNTVVELCCGTGLNFGLLERKIGAGGHLIGVDLTDSMLAGAQERCRRNSWSNVELVHSDAANFHFPQQVNGIISTFALTLVPEYEDVIRRSSGALVQGGRFVILDFKLPNNRLARLAPAFVFATSPFGVSHDLASRHPWEALKRYFINVSLTEFYGGFAYVAAGERWVERSSAERGGTCEEPESVDRRFG